jgi:Putative neutral zinc metallopeptidase
VIAHEIGHHVQNQLGITEKMAHQRARAGEEGNNARSVLIELQADCFAGVWGHFARQRKLLDPGDVESGLAAAAAIGDDRLQRQSRGHVSPEVLHPRHLGPARALVPRRARLRRRAPVQHLRDRPPLRPGLAAASLRAAGSSGSLSLRVKRRREQASRGGFNYGAV